MRCLFLFFLLPGFFAVSAWADTAVPHPGNVPRVVWQGVDNYLRTGHSAALNYWKNEYTPIEEGRELEKRLLPVFREMEREYGKLLKVEPIVARRVSASYRQYYLLFGYRHDILFVRFDVYKTELGDRIQDAHTSRVADGFLPELTTPVTKAGSSSSRSAKD